MAYDGTSAYEENAELWCREWKTAEALPESEPLPMEKEVYRLRERGI